MLDGETLGGDMTAALEIERVKAPTRLVAESRVAFRDAVLVAHEATVTAKGTIVQLDLGDMEDVDASGLGTLVVLQKRARERGLTTQLVGVQPRVRRLLANTRLEALFEFA